MNNTDDILSSTGSGCNWCPICWPAKKQVSDALLWQLDPFLQKPQKLKGKSKLSQPPESTHRKLNVSPAHVYDNKVLVLVLQVRRLESLIITKIIISYLVIMPKSSPATIQ